jgi:CDGSH iron-sulfur domain-containing protein 3
MNHVAITPTDNGPYLVKGSVTLLDPEGNEYEVNDTIALCRCGRSSTKPFCDGTHEQTPFIAVNRRELPRSLMAPAVAGR